MESFLTYTLIGVVAGSIYAITACGLVVTYTTSGIFNFAHGAIGMVAAWTYWQFRVGWHWPAPFALLIVLVVLAPLFGALIERVLIRPLQGAAVDLTLGVTLGLLLALIGLANLLWNPSQIRILPLFYRGSDVSIGGIKISYNQIAVIVVAIGVAVALRLFFARTRTGIAMRAVVDNPDLVAMAGGPPVRIRQLSWAMGATLAALAGILLAPIVTLTHIPLTLLVINGYAAAMVGRLKSLPLTVAGAMMVGLGTTYAVGYFEAEYLKKIQLIIPMILLFIVLVVLPQDRLRFGTLAPSGAPRPAGLRSSLVAGVVLVGTAIVLSQLLGTVNLRTAGRSLALGCVLLSLVLLTGYGGLASLCQMTFVGIGAYAMGTWAKGGSPLGLLAATGLAALFGIVVALPTLRLRGLYLALATLAFAQAMDTIFFTEVLGSGGSILVPRPSIPGVNMTDEAYLIVLSMVFAGLGVGVLALRRGRWGRRLAALNDSPAACATLGLNITWTKLAVFAASAGLAGFGGALFAAVPGQVSNNDFVLLNSLAILLIARIGGINTVTGALLGGVFFSTFPVIAQAFPSLANVTLLLTGLGAISLSHDPNGMGGRVAEAAAHRRARRAARAQAAASPGESSAGYDVEDSLARV